jgi:hypothetical protein
MAWVAKEEYTFGSSLKTGSIDDIKTYHVIEYLFGKHEIDVVVDSDNKFIGILEVRTKKDFLTPQQRAATRSFIDVDEYYKE